MLVPKREEAIFYSYLAGPDGNGNLKEFYKAIPRHRFSLNTSNFGQLLMLFVDRLRGLFLLIIVHCFWGLLLGLMGFLSCYLALIGREKPPATVLVGIYFMRTLFPYGSIFPSFAG